MAGEMMGATPVYDVCGNNGNFGGGTWTWVFLLFILLAWGGNGFGFGGRNDAYQAGLTRAELCDGFNFNQIENGIRGVQNGLCDGFYAQNTTMLQGFNGIQRDMCQGFSTLNSGITNLGYQMQNCCCDTNRNIDAVRYEAAKNTCDITTAIHAEGEATATVTVNTAIVNLKFATIVQVLNSCNCVKNDVDLTVINNGVQANLTNANIVVVKLA